MSVSNQTIRLPHLRDDWAVHYTQSDVDVIRTQIIQGEATKRRSLILGLIVATGGLIVTIALLSTVYARYAHTEALNDQLLQQNAVTAQSGAEAQQGLDAFRERDAEQEATRAEAQALVENLLSGRQGAEVSALQGGNLARAVHQLGGRVETTSRPPDHLFRNWKVTAGSSNEIYTVVGGFVDGRWVIYSNLVARRQPVQTGGGDPSHQ